jgi:cleavage stimulation factor subunit 2
VDMAEPEKGGAGRRPPPGPPNSNRPPPMAAPKGGLPPNLPSGIPVPPGMTATDSITQTLATMPPDQLLDILSQMKAGRSLCAAGLH